MAYCILDDVKPLIPTMSFSDTTTPSTTQAGTIIGVVSSELDAVLLTNGWALPVSNATMLALLKAACQYGSAGAIMRARFPVAEGVGGDQGGAQFWERRYLSMKNIIASKTLSSGSLLGETEPFGDGFPTPDEDENLEATPWTTRETEY